jgi:hypothetical protein
MVMVDAIMAFNPARGEHCCCIGLQDLCKAGSLILMFSIEHEFDSTTVTLVDEGTSPLQEDITLNAFAECVTVEQLDPRTDQVQKITLSHTQVQDLAAALDLPEGVYRLIQDKV